MRLFPIRLIDARTQPEVHHQQPRQHENQKGRSHLGGDDRNNERDDEIPFSRSTGSLPCSRYRSQVESNCCNTAPLTSGPRSARTWPRVPSTSCFNASLLAATSIPVLSPI